MDDEGKREQTRHEDASLPEKSHRDESENPDALLNGDQKDEKRPPEEAFMDCLGTILLAVVLVAVSIIFVCLVSIPTFR